MENALLQLIQILQEGSSLEELLSSAELATITYEGNETQLWADVQKQLDQLQTQKLAA